MKRTWKQIGSLFLAFCMVFTMLPTMAFAETGDVDSGTPLGASGTITAFTELPAETVVQSVYTGTTKDELILPKELTASITESGGETATGSDASRETQTTVAVDRWTSDPAYDGDTAVDYVFTPTLALPEDWTLAEGATLPTITVTVEEQPAAPQARGMAGPLGAGIITGTMDVGGTTVSDLTQDHNGTGWTWDAASATLTLISSYQGGYINFKCDNTNTINLVCSGAVTVNKGSTYAIDCGGSLVIRGDGLLTLSGALRASKDIVILGKMGDISGGGSSGIDAGGSISIYGAVGNITGSIAIYAIGDVTIYEAASVSKIGAGGNGPNSSAYGIYSQNGSVTINGATGDISGRSYGIHAKGGNAFINGTTGAISGVEGSFLDNSAIRASGSVAINGTTGAISSKGGYGIYAESGAVLISGKTGDITGTKVNGIYAASAGITIPLGAVVGNIAGAQNGINTSGGVTIGGKTGDITGVAGSILGGGISAGGSVTITGETGAITSTHPSVSAIDAGGDVTIVGSVGEIAMTTPSAGSGQGILALGDIYIINSVTVSSFNGAFNKAPATLPTPSYTATWSDNPDGSASSTGSAYVWSDSHKYVKIEKDSGTSAPTVSGFRAERRDADTVRFFFTPSTTGKYGYSILKQGLAEPSNISMLNDIKSIGEFNIDSTPLGVTASDILVVYLQIESAEGVKSQIYSLEVPAYTPPADAAAPIITYQPSDESYMQNEVPAFILLVTASSTDGGALSYQWYSNTTDSTAGGTPAAGSTSNGFVPSTAAVGTTYYYCVVTNTNDSATGNKTASATSNTAKVTVNAPAATGTMYVGGTPYVDLAANRTGTGWEWDAATATLTLDSSYGGSNIQIVCDHADTINLVYIGDVSITGSSNLISALVCHGSLNINGSGGMLTVDYTNSSSDYVALEVWGKLNIQSGTLHAISAGSGLEPFVAAVIFASAGVSITGSANVTATATGAVSDGITTNPGGDGITISTSGTVTVDGKGTQYALNTSSSVGSIHISNGTVTLTNSDTPANLYFGALNHTGGTLNGNPPPGGGTPTITVTKHPQNVTVTQGRINATLTAEAVASNGKPVSYQWFRFIGGIGSDNVEIIPGATSDTFPIPTNLTAGTYRYLCIFNTDGNDYVDSNTAIVTVNPPSGSGDNGGNGGGSSSGGGSTLPATTTTPTAATPDQPVTAAILVTATAGAGGTANAPISDKSISDAIAKAQADAKAQNKTANGIAVAVNVTMPQGTDSLTATLTQNSLNSLVSAGVTSLEINGAPVSISLDLKALQEIQKQSGGNISIIIAPAAGLSSQAQTMIGNRPAYDITIRTVKDGETGDVASLGSGTAILTIPYTPAAGESTAHLFGVYVDEKGNAVRIKGSAYDAEAGGILISASHFSVYGVGYAAASERFTDIASHWGRESIDYVAGRGLLSGTSETTFAPDTAMTRGMLVTALGRLTGVDAKEYRGSSFTDVTAGQYYAPYIEWAYGKGIVKGTGNSQFVPNRPVTREEIAVIFANYVKAAGQTLPSTHEATIYGDADRIGSIYKDGVTAMQQAGIMMGDKNKKFNPKASATRAEVAAILQRYLELTD